MTPPARARGKAARPPAPPSAAVGILVLGMHRSGTSAIARVLNLLGADLGSRLLPAVPDVNDAGFWEHADAVAIDEKLLLWHARPWHAVQPPPALGEHLARQARRDIAVLIGRDFAASPLWAIKDPRMSLLAPVWIDALAETGVSARVVVAVRHPDEVAASLHRRDGLTRAHANLLWGLHFVEAVRASEGVPRALCDYAALLADWRGAVGRIGAALDVRWPIEPAEAATAIDAFLQPDQRRHRAGDASVESADPLQASVLALHAAAVAVAAGEAGWEVLEGPIARFERARVDTASLVQELLEHVWAHADRARAAELQLARVQAAGPAAVPRATSTGARLVSSERRNGWDRRAMAAPAAEGEATPLQSRLEMAHQAIAALEQVVEQQNDALGSSGEARRQLEAALAEVQAHAAALEAARDELHRLHEVGQARLAEKDDRLAAAVANGHRLEAALADLHAHACALEAAREDLRRGQDVALARLAEKDERLALALDDRQRLEASLAELHTHANALEAAREEARRGLEVAQARLAERQERLAVALDDRQRLDASLAELHAHASALEAAREDARRGLEVAQARLAEKDERLAAALGHQQRLEASLAEVHAHAAALDAARAELGRQLEAAQAEARSLQRVAEEKEARLVQAGDAQRRQDAALAGLGAHAQALEGAREALRAEVEALRREADAAAHRNDAALAQWQAHAQALEAARGELRARVETLERELAVAGALAPRLQQRVDETDARLASAEARYEAASRALAALEHDLAVLRNSRSWRMTAPLRAMLAWLRPRA